MIPFLMRARDASWVKLTSDYSEVCETKHDACCLCERNNEERIFRFVKSLVAEGSRSRTDQRVADTPYWV